MKLLITGGCGFLGSNLTAHSIKNGLEVVVFDNLYREGSLTNLNWLKTKGAFQFVHGDIRNQSDVSKVVHYMCPDAVFHLAGQVAMTTSIANPRLDFEVNAIGTHNLLEAVRLSAPNASVLYSSTNKVYGDLKQYSYRETESRYECIDKPKGFDENTPLEFHSPYGCSKGSADQYMLDYARIYGLSTVVFRHSSMYGGRQFATYDQGWVGWFCQQAFAIKKGTLKYPFTISGNGKQVRDVLHADDLATLYFATLDKMQTARGNAFNVGGGITNSLSLLELFGLLESFSNVKLIHTNLAPRESDQLVFVSDLKKVEALVGWTPKVSASKGIKMMFEWVSQF
jgi:CDP-paratose 2-epimerase